MQPGLVGGAVEHSVRSTVDGLQSFVSCGVVEGRSSPEADIAGSQQRYFVWGGLIVVKHGQIILIDGSHSLLLDVREIGIELIQCHGWGW
jgi:hypothetical protein